MKWWFSIAAVVAFAAFLGLASPSVGAMTEHAGHGMVHAETSEDPMCILHCLTEATAVEEVVALVAPPAVTAFVAVVLALVVVPFVERRVHVPVWVCDPSRRRMLLTKCKRE